MKSETRVAPFTDEEVRILKLWQENDYLHPYTCCDHEPMRATTEGLKCERCGILQEWVHDFSLRESAATYNPIGFPIEIVDGKPKFKGEKDE